jgi:hypothetical protein
VRIGGCYTDCIRNNIFLAALTALLSLPLYAVDAGKAEGTMIVAGTPIKLAYAYAVGGQKNEDSGRTDDVRIILTDRALPDGFELRNIESAYPDGVVGIVFDIDNDRQPAHIYIQHPNGMYDGGYFSKSDIYRFRGRVVDGVLDGRFTARKVTTSTAVMSFDVTFAAEIR